MDAIKGMLQQLARPNGVGIPNFLKQLPRFLFGKSLIGRFFTAFLFAEITLGELRSINAKLINTIAYTKKLKEIFAKYSINKKAEYGPGGSLFKDISGNPGKSYNMPYVPQNIQTDKPNKITPPSTETKQEIKPVVNNESSTSNDIEAMCRELKPICDKLNESTSSVIPIINKQFPDYAVCLIIYPSYNVDIVELSAACANKDYNRVINIKNNIEKQLTQEVINNATQISLMLNFILEELGGYWDDGIKILKQYGGNWLEGIQNYQNKVQTIKNQNNLDVMNKDQIIKDLFLDIKNYIINKNGKIEHADIQIIAKHIDEVVNDRIMCIGERTINLSKKKFIKLIKDRIDFCKSQINNTGDIKIRNSYRRCVLDLENILNNIADETIFEKLFPNLSGNPQSNELDYGGIFDKKVLPSFAWTYKPEPYANYKNITPVQNKENLPNNTFHNNDKELKELLKKQPGTSK